MWLWASWPSSACFLAIQVSKALARKFRMFRPKPKSSVILRFGFVENHPTPVATNTGVFVKLSARQLHFCNILVNETVSSSSPLKVLTIQIYTISRPHVLYVILYRSLLFKGTRLPDPLLVLLPRLRHLASICIKFNN